MNNDRKASIWNAENTVSAVEQFVQKYGRLPVAKEMKPENSLPSRGTFKNKVGLSFYEYGKRHHPDLVEQSERRHRWHIAFSVQERSAWTKETLIASVELFAKQHGRLPDIKEYASENNLPSYSTFCKIAEATLTDYLGEHFCEYINQTPTPKVADIEKDFEAGIRELIPDADQEAMQKWIGYARELDRDGTHSAADFFDKIYTELALVKRHDGDEIARQLFDAGRSFTFNPDEIRGAARFLKQGMSMRNICQKALNGFCDPTPQDRLESRDMLSALRESWREQGNGQPEQGRSPLDKKLKSFTSEQARLIQDAVEQVVSYALKEAEPDEDELYCEVDYDIVNRCLSPLDDIGTRLSIEKLAGLIDAHPAVNYSDYHNTGITVYFNSSEILQGLGLRPGQGMTGMQL